MYYNNSDYNDTRAQYSVRIVIDILYIYCHFM